MSIYIEKYDYANKTEFTFLFQYMYLEGNDIAFLPDEFFKFFPCLRWLDLRNNQLSRIPSFFLSNHQFLRNLLLEGNNLRNLPLELGKFDIGICYVTRLTNMRLNMCSIIF